MKKQGCKFSYEYHMAGGKQNVDNLSLAVFLPHLQWGPLLPSIYVIKYIYICHKKVFTGNEKNIYLKIWWERF